MNETPKCPYCGAEMEDDSCCWICPKCHASSPIVIYEEKAKSMTEDEKTAYAREAALRRAEPGERYGNNTENAQECADAQAETLLIAELLEKVKAIEDERPYHIAGHYDTYSDYNQGWQAACTRIEEMLEARLEKQ